MFSFWIVGQIYVTSVARPFCSLLIKPIYVSLHVVGLFCWPVMASSRSLPQKKPWTSSCPAWRWVLSEGGGCPSFWLPLGFRGEVLGPVPPVSPCSPGPLPAVSPCSPGPLPPVSPGGSGSSIQGAHHSVSPRSPTGWNRGNALASCLTEGSCLVQIHTLLSMATWNKLKALLQNYTISINNGVYVCYVSD